MKENIKIELKNLHDDCKYTAEAHYNMANDGKTVDFWSRLIPAIATASLSVFEVYLQPESNTLIMLILASSVVTAITNVMGGKEKYEIHNDAGRKFTHLKKLCNKAVKIDSELLDEKQLYDVYNTLLSQYLEVVDQTPPTENKAFMKGRKRIQEDKVHEPD